MVFKTITKSNLDTKELGAKLGKLLKAGDAVLLDGELGAGKTTFTQGIASSLNIKGEVTSPTFVIAREHKSLDGKANLVHVDAYRLSTLAEISQLDLTSDLEESILVVEWGKDLVNDLVENPIRVKISHTENDNEREIEINAKQETLGNLK
jgi:tRNA threonylcarbamoyladenosine biosynthesis protein TsaE